MATRIIPFAFLVVLAGCASVESLNERIEKVEAKHEQRLAEERQEHQDRIARYNRQHRDFISRLEAKKRRLQD